jgi:hypothetical protein
MRDQREQLMRKFRNADMDDRPALLREIAEFSRRNPEQSITRAQLLRSLRTQTEREARIRRYGDDLQDDEAVYAEEGEIYNVN